MLKSLKEFLKGSKKSKNKISIWDIIPQNVYQMTKANNQYGGSWNLDAYNSNGKSIFLGTIRRNLYGDNVQFPVGSFSQKPKK